MMFKFTKKWLMCLGWAFLSMQTSVVGAQNPIRQATTEQILEQLAPPTHTTRGMRNIIPTPKSVDLSIQFAFNSSKIESVSKPLLSNLAQALNSDRLLRSQILVEGHTDAKGTEAYNDELSLRRAEAVADFLFALGVERERVMTQGKGFHELLYADKPYSEENRRVKVQVSAP